MADSTNFYAISYGAALAHYNNTRHGEAVEHAKTNLRDPTLPRYWQAKNCIPIICAAESWYEAEVCVQLYELLAAHHPVLDSALMIHLFPVFS